MKCEVTKYQEMLESREALISATGFALDHVIEQAKIELTNLYAQHHQPSIMSGGGDNNSTQN